MERGVFGDLYTWIVDEEVYNRVFRLRIRDGVSGSFSVYQHKVILHQFIEMPDKDFLVGFKMYDRTTGALEENITYVRLSDMMLQYFKEDQQDDL